MTLSTSRAGDPVTRSRSASLALTFAVLVVVLGSASFAAASFNGPLCPSSRAWSGARCEADLAWFIAAAFGLPLIPWFLALAAVLAASRPWRRPPGRKLAAWGGSVLVSIAPVASSYVATAPFLMLAARVTDERGPLAVVLWLGGPATVWLLAVLVARRVVRPR
jgi:hypothetical protein